MRATKMGHVEQLLSQVVSAKDFRVVCVIPFQMTGLSLHVPHQRWKQLLSKWKPATAMYCSCQITNNKDVHHRFRVFCSGLTVTDQMCATTSTNTAAPDLRNTRYFIRAWIQKVLGVADGRTDECTQLLVYPHRSLLKPTGYSSNRQTQLPSCEAQLEETATSVLHSTNRTKRRQCRGNLLVDPATAYPTDSRERQKAKEKKDKEAGIERVVVKKFKKVEDHYDDCGDCLDSIVTDVNALEVPDDPHDLEDDHAKNSVYHNLGLHMLWGGDEPVQVSRIQTIHLGKPHEMAKLLSYYPSKFDIAEIIGGQATNAQINVRRMLTNKKNFDFLVHCNLTDRENCYHIIQYFRTSPVRVAVIAPILTEKGHDVAAVCGHIAHTQMQQQRHFIQHQPTFAAQYQGVSPWPAILSQPGIVQQTYDRCMCDLKDASGHFIQKQAVLTATHPDLVQPFANLFCKENHEHVQLGQAELFWTAQEAEKIIDGLELLGSAPSTVTAYPIDLSKVAKSQQGGASTRGPDPRAPPFDQSSCKGCNKSRARNNWEHTREIGQCKYPYDDPVIPECEGCQKYRHRDNKLHFDASGVRLKSCVCDTKQERNFAPRTGKHPRDPATPASAADATTDLRGTVPGGRELGADAEERTASTSSASGSAGGDPLVDPSSDSSAPSKRAIPAGKTGPVTEEREKVRYDRSAQPSTKRTWEDSTRSGNATIPDDWSKFDVNRSLRALRHGTESDIKLILRKLHIRWWHATSAAMTRMLGAAGVPDTVVQMIPQVVQTCRVC